MRKSIVRLVAVVFALLCADVAAAGTNSVQGKRDLKIGQSRQLVGEAVVNLGTTLRRRAGATSGLSATPSHGKALASHRTSQGPPVDWNSARASTTLQWAIARDSASGTPIFIRNRSTTLAGKRAQRSSGPAAELAMAVIEDHRDLFKLEDPRFELGLKEVVKDHLGNEHVRFQQQYDGVPVLGQELVVHLDPGGFMSSINGRYLPTPGFGMSVEPAIQPKEAMQTATDHLAQRVEVQPITGQLAALMKYNGPVADLHVVIEGLTPRLTWKVLVRPNWRDRWVYFIDAQTGEVVDCYNSTPTDGPTSALAEDLKGQQQTIQVYEVDDEFIMVDASRSIFQTDQPDVIWDPRGALWTLTQDFVDLGDDYLFQVLSSDNTWSDPVAVSAHANMGRVFDYFLQVHGRESVDGKGGTLISVIHATIDGESMENAYWTGEMMVYGDGGSFFEPLAKALDVAAHEFTHGVIEQTVNLEYRLESGALNESFADVFGAMVDREDWLMGEDVTKMAPALRDLETPENGDQPGHMNDFLDLDALNELYGNSPGTSPDDSNDLGGVHINSGIPNRACFLIAEQLGREKTEQIYYRILEARYLISQARFIDMRLAAEQAAIDLFGESSIEVNAVLAAFDAVGIVNEVATQAPDDVAATVGDQWIVMVNAEESDVSLLRAKPDSEEIQWISDTQVSFATGKPVSVSADGHEVFFIDAENFIRAVYVDGTGEEVLTTTGEWGSLALSPDGTKLAVTTVYEDTTIFIFDLLDENNDKEIKLYNPTTQAGIAADVVRFADVLDWNADSRHLLYDAFSSLSLGEDDELGYWSINMLDTESEVIFPLFSGLPEGVHLANPSFANTNEAFVVFDFFDDESETNEIWVFDTFTGDSGFILGTGPNFAFPSFSSDDGHLAFEFWDEDQLNVHQIALGEGRLEAVGANEFFLHEVQLPTWVTVAPNDAATVVESHEESLPTTFRLQQNFPNPFNSSTVIRLDVPLAGDVMMAVFNLAGQKVATLVDGQRQTGSYQVQWDGTDDAGRNLASGVYMYRVHFDGVNQATRKLLILR